jgi:hypothetical protein
MLEPVREKPERRPAIRQRSGAVPRGRLKINGQGSWRLSAG